MADASAVMATANDSSSSITWAGFSITPHKVVAQERVTSCASGSYRHQNQAVRMIAVLGQDIHPAFGQRVSYRAQLAGLFLF